MTDECKKKLKPVFSRERTEKLKKHAAMLLSA